MKRRIVIGGIIVIFALLMASCSNAAGGSSGKNATEKIILGNIITMDDAKPRAEAVAIKDGIIISVGSESEVRKSVSNSAEVLDYKSQWVYPGFMEAHAHGMLAGQRAISQADLTTVPPPMDKDKYAKIVEIIKKFIQDNPGKEVYVAAGWAEDGYQVDHTLLDDILPYTPPILMNTSGGHSSLLNAKAMEKYGINKAAVDKWGTDKVRVDKDGNPTGYICEEPAIEILGKIPATLPEIKEYLLNWQERAFSEGITAAGDAGVDLLSPLALQAYKELQEEGKLKLRTYAYLLAKDNQPDPVGKALEVANKAKELNGEYFKIIGLKAFIDGVVEAHTAWLLQDYDDKPGYTGVSRFNNESRMVTLIVAAQKYGLSVHVHSEGDRATQFMLGCIEKAQSITRDNDQRNAISHLHLVSDADIKRFADTNTIAAVPPQWVAAYKGVTDQEVNYIGSYRSDNTYPIKSFFDKRAKTVFHSDFPISANIDIPLSILMATTRGTNELGLEKFDETKRNEKEAITIQQSLEALTTNIAYAWHEEDRLGSITPGKLANFTVVDKDFLNCVYTELPDAKIMATIIDGDVVYKGK